MNTCFASLMSVPVRNGRRALFEDAVNASVDYGLLLNRRELARYDGRTDELPVLIAYRGRIYDATGHEPTDGDDANWQRYAGRDCTADLRGQPRCYTWLMSLPCVGALED
jgi:predicted heme/steroid binding protein